jgi:hypothetical protein
LRRDAAFGDLRASLEDTGGFKLDPGFAASYDLRPFSLSPPSGFLPAFFVHASDITYPYSLDMYQELLQYVRLCAHEQCDHF